MTFLSIPSLQLNGYYSYSLSVLCIYDFCYEGRSRNLVTEGNNPSTLIHRCKLMFTHLMMTCLAFGFSGLRASS